MSCKKMNILVLKEDKPEPEFPKQKVKKKISKIGDNGIMAYTLSNLQD